MVSSAALCARTSGHRMLVFMKPFLEQQGIFWLPPAGAEAQQASAGPKYWSFNFSINPSNEYSGLILFRMDWLDLLAVQGIPANSPAH